mgnify:CR=1 FL=1
MANHKRMVEFNGETLSVGQWSKKTGIAHGTLTNRLDGGWSAERALTTKPDSSFTAKKDCKISKNETKVVQMQGFPHQAKYGQLFRRKHPAAFQKWFSDTYCQ